MRKLLLLIPLLCGFAAPPDDEAVLRATLDGAGEYYYPALMQRYADGDPALTAADYYYLYYGYAFRDEYRPLDPIPEADSILMIIDRSHEPDSAACVEIIRLGEQVLQRDPFSPMNLNMMAYAYTILGEVEAAQLNASRVAHILETIQASGSGLSEKSPWVVLSFSHAEDVVKSRNQLPTSRRIVSRSVEYIDIGQRGSGVKGYFFDFSRAYRSRPDEIPRPEKKDSGWMINGIRLKSRR